MAPACCTARKNALKSVLSYSETLQTCSTRLTMIGETVARLSGTKIRAHTHLCTGAVRHTESVVKGSFTTRACISLSSRNTPPLKCHTVMLCTADSPCTSNPKLSIIHGLSFFLLLSCLVISYALNTSGSCFSTHGSAEFSDYSCFRLSRSPPSQKRRPKDTTINTLERVGTRLI